ncbi:MAG TPA: hypothetical protein VIY48_14970 [Candidatus Paceibacterota bacterium]|jgi:hypothetical protein
MHNILMLESDEIIRLMEASSRAQAEGRTFRVCMDSDGFKWKVGEGMWTPGYGFNEAERARYEYERDAMPSIPSSDGWTGD